MRLEKFEWLSSSYKFFKKISNPNMIHCCEAVKSMLSSYFCTTRVLIGAYKSKHTPKPILSQNMVYFT